MVSGGGPVQDARRLKAIGQFYVSGSTPESVAAGNCVVPQHGRRRSNRHRHQSHHPRPHPTLVALIQLRAETRQSGTYRHGHAGGQSLPGRLPRSGHAAALARRRSARLGGRAMNAIPSRRGLLIGSAATLLAGAVTASASPRWEADTELVQLHRALVVQGHAMARIVAEGTRCPAASRRRVRTKNAGWPRRVTGGGPWSTGSPQSRRKAWLGSGQRRRPCCSCWSARFARASATRSLISRGHLGQSEEPGGCPLRARPPRWEGRGMSEENNTRPRTI